MPTERYTIIFTESGGRTVKTSMDAMAASATVAAGGVNKVNVAQKAAGAGSLALASAMKAAAIATGAFSAAIATAQKALFSLQTLVAGFALITIIDMVDTYRNLQNRLRVVTKDQDELRDTTVELFNIAQRTRFTFEDTAETYARLAFNTRDLGLSQRDLFQITETLNQALVVGGARAQEGSNALIQLSQAFATGRLRADEFRAVTEQLPVVADAIASELGVTRGELLRLSIQGQITNEVMVNAFKNSADIIEGRFGKTLPTVQQSFTRLRNAFERAFGELNEGSGISEKFAEIVLDVVGNIDALKRVIVTVSASIAIFVSYKIAVLMIDLLWDMAIASRAAGVAILALGRWIIIAAGSITKLNAALLVGKGLALLRGLAPILIAAASGLATLAAVAAVPIGIKILVNNTEPDTFFGKFVRNLDESFNRHLGPPGVGQLITIIDEEREKRALAEVERIIRQFQERTGPIDALPVVEPLLQNVQEIGRELIPILAAFEDQYELLQKSGIEYEKAVRILKIERQIERSLNDVEREAVGLLINRNLLEEDRIKFEKDLSGLQNKNRLLTLGLDTQRQEAEVLRIQNQLVNELTRQQKDQIRVEVQKGIDQTRANSLQEILANLREENRILKLNGVEREVQLGILNAERAIGAPILGWNRIALSILLAQNAALNERKQKDIYGDEIRSLERSLQILKETGDEREVLSTILQLESQLEGKLTDVQREKLALLVKQRLELERIERFGESLDNLAAENRILRLNVGQQELARALRAEELAIGRDLSRQERRVLVLFTQGNEKLRERNAILDELRGPSRELENRLQNLDFMLRHQIITLNEYRRALRDTFKISNELQNLEDRLNELAFLLQQGAINSEQFKEQIAKAFQITTLQQSIGDIRFEMEKYKILLQLGAISAFEYKVAIDELNASVLSLEARLGGGSALQQFVAGAKAAFAELNLELNRFGANIQRWLIDSFKAAEDAVVSWAKTGKFEFAQFASVVVEELLRITLRVLFLKALGFAFGGGTNASTNLTGGTDIGGGQIGLQHGGSFLVPGSGGPDSQLVSFRATPRERVIVETSRQQQQRQDMPIIVNVPPVQINLVDDRDEVEGDRVFLSKLRRNRAAVRRELA